MLAKALLDQNPDMKNQAARFSGKLATTLGKRVGSYMKAITDSLTQNLAHQHSKVRRETMKGLRDVVVCKGAEPFVEGSTLAQLRFTSNDRSQDVRAEFYKVLFFWMTNMEIMYLRNYESPFVQFLLNGIADDKLDIGPQCITFLEEHGTRMKEALKALGEDEENEEMTSEEKDLLLQEENRKKAEAEVKA